MVTSIFFFSIVTIILHVCKPTAASEDRFMTFFSNFDNPDTGYLLETMHDSSITKSVTFENCKLDRIPVNFLHHLPSLDTFNAVSTSIKELKPSTFSSSYKLRNVDLSYNHLQRIPDHTFEGAINLHELDLSHNKINSVEQNSFSQLTELDTLDMSYNQIDMIHPETMWVLSQVTKIFLRYNRLRVLDTNLFLKNFNLEILTLDHNEIAVIEPMLLENRPSILSVAHLHLQNNRLSDIENLLPFERLQHLDLSNNVDLELKTNTFEKFWQLKSLYLDKTNMAHVGHNFSILGSLRNLVELKIAENNLSPQQIDQLPSLRYLEQLSIEKNSLTEVDYSLMKTKFPSLKLIGVNGNPWKCSYLQTMLDHLEGQGVSVDLWTVDTVAHESDINGVNCYSTWKRILFIMAGTLFLVLLFLLGISCKYYQCLPNKPPGYVEPFEDFLIKENIANNRYYENINFVDDDRTLYENTTVYQFSK
jgi:Leucine-rich repeat (LRR) protein